MKLQQHRKTLLASSILALITSTPQAHADVTIQDGSIQSIGTGNIKDISCQSYTIDAGGQLTSHQMARYNKSVHLLSKAHSTPLATA